MSEPAKAAIVVERFAEIAAAYLADAAVTQGTGFGKSPGLRVGGRIFAMLAHGQLVVKLPRDRVDALVAAGAAARFDPGHGRLMKEWAAVPPSSGEPWHALAAEAFALVAGRETTRRQRIPTGLEPS